MKTNRPIGIRFLSYHPEGRSQDYARWDGAKFEPWGTADVQVEVMTDVWRRARVAIVRALHKTQDEKDLLFAVSAAHKFIVSAWEVPGLLEASDINLGPKVPTPAATKPPKREPAFAGLQPSKEFIGKNGG